MKKIKFCVLIALFIQISFNSFSQNDSLKFSIGIVEQQLFCDYGIFISKQFTRKNSVQMNISKVFKDYLGDEIYGVTGISTGIQYNYNWKFTKYYPYISTGFQYRMYNADSVLYFSDTWQYSESILSHGISIKSGWGYKVTINKIYISTLLGLQCNYDFTRKTNYFIHYDLFNDLKNHNNNKNMVYVLPVLDLYIGWHL